MSRRDANKHEFSYERTVNLIRRETAFSSAEEDTASANFPRLKLSQRRYERASSSIQARKKHIGPRRQRQSFFARQRTRVVALGGERWPSVMMRIGSWCEKSVAVRSKSMPPHPRTDNRSEPTTQIPLVSQCTNFAYQTVALWLSANAVTKSPPIVDPRASSPCIVSGRAPRHWLQAHHR